MRYRRLRVEGGTYFFTIVTYKRRPIFRNPETVSALLSAINSVKSAHPFEIVAQVVLPDHLHSIWTLPDRDSDFPMRWRQIKSAFTRAYVKNAAVDVIPESRRAKGEQTVWQRRL
jgi:putative transposase